MRKQHLNIFPLVFDEFPTDFINQTQSLVYRRWAIVKGKYRQKC